MLNKKLLLVVILDKEIFYKNQPIHMDTYGYACFLLSISSLSFGNSYNKCLKSLSSKFPAKECKEALQN